MKNRLIQVGFALTTCLLQAANQTDEVNNFYLKNSDIRLGYDEGLFFETVDQNNSLKINILMQNRFVYDSRGGEPSNPHFHNTGDFENTRDMLNFSGRLMSNGYYNLRLEFGAYDMITPKVTWGYGGYAINDNWNFSAGVLRVPTNREWTINDEYQLGVARSLTTTFIDAQDPGLQFGFTSSMWRLNAYVTNGYSGTVVSPKTFILKDSYQQPYASGKDSWRVGARCDWIVLSSDCTSPSPCVKGQGPDSSGRISLNNWAKFDEFTSPWSESLSILVGGWLSFNRIHLVPVVLGAPGVSGHSWIATVDSQIQLPGGSVYLLGWAAPSHVETTWDSLLENKTPWGFLAQAGVYALRNLEFIARYEFAEWYDNQWITLSNPSRNSSIITGGFNWYLGGQKVKISGNYSYSWRPISNPISIPEVAQTNWLGDSIGQDAQQLVQFQLQTFF